MIAKVIVDIENNQVNRPFDYLIPSFLEDVVEVGHRVIVPFSNRKIMGYVILISDKTDYINKLKEIISLVDILKPLTNEFIDLAKDMANRYFSFYSTIFNAMIPSALKLKYKRRILITDRNKCSDELLSKINKKGEAIFDNKLNEYLKEINKGIKQGYISLENIIKKRSNDKIDKYVIVRDSSIKVNSIKGRNLLSYLEEINSPVLINDLISDMDFSQSVINTLVNNKVLEIIEKERAFINEEINTIDKIVDFTNEQTLAYEEIKRSFSEDKVFLLHGITGSGKTEIYLELINDVINSGKEAILLVPEISLTPQMTNRFKSRFKSSVAVIHSRLTISEKYNEWKRIINGNAKIVVGARSAIFAPFKNLGIIIVDEEHESSYKQDTNPKYDAVEIAIKRGKYHKALVLLGSATPKVKDYYLALNNEYTLVELKNRPYNMKLPSSEIVDMRDELKNGNKSVLSIKLQKAIIDCYNKGEQSILFINRRGYSSFVMCRDCGKTIECPHCDISLTYHKFNNKLKCHNCGYEIDNVIICPECKSSKIKFVGMGTQKITEALAILLPEAKVLRMDFDTTRERFSYEEVYQMVYSGETDILVGTQMVAKGFDFPKVTLVGVINADLALNYPAYDSYEICYNLIEQVSGRAGRNNLESKVFIQTYNPDNYAITSAAKHDYSTFYNKEILKRKIALYPPFSELIEITIEGIDPQKTYEYATNIKRNLDNVIKYSIIYGPTEATIFKLNDKYRFIINIKINDDIVLEKISYIVSENQSNKDVNILITRM